MAAQAKQILMHCDQCSMSLPGGCRLRGVCGKDPDLNALQEALIYGLKGISAYYYHAVEMGYHDTEIGDFLAEALYTTLTNVNFDKQRFLEYILEAGKMHLRAMELLDKAYVENFGAPQPVRVPTGTVNAHGILVTGHSYKALYELLKQIREQGLEDEIKVYTHSEMLPAHSYPKLREFKSLYGNYGSSWVPQRVEFARFPGPIVGTSNCVLQPPRSYADRIFTVSVAGLEGVPHIRDYDYTPVIKKALETPKLPEKPGPTIPTGYHHTNVIPLLDKVIELMNEGKIRHIFVIGGCDVPNPKMSYYRRLIEILPKESIVLTAACGKFRYIDLADKLGDIEGIPRMMDFGQCNNVYSIIQVAAALAKKLGVDDLNELPVSIVLSWMEQKAVAILYTLLYLGIRGIYLGPKLPEFLTPNVAKILQEKFDIRLITEPEQDLKRMLEEKKMPKR